VSVSVFVEGGGPQRMTQTACRKAFRLFFEKVLGDRPKPRIVASGSRDEAYRDFSRSLENDPDTFPVLLVDSEDAVTRNSATAHLRAREGHWINLPDGQVYLMVQCMETWFLADIPAVKQYYGPDFKASALPGNPNIEQIPKRDVMNGLREATRATGKGRYHKTRHGFDILGRIDPGDVQRRSEHVEALFTLLLARLNVGG
jgi:hypothetical protein